MADTKRNCSVEGCQRPHKGRGYCRLHLRRLRENGDPLKATKDKPFKPCTIEGCDGKHFAHGWCRKHYLRWWSNGSTETKSGRASKGDLPKFLQDNAAHDGDDCLLWPFKTRHHGGYGGIRFRGVATPASRAMCILAHGEPPTPEHEAAHGCGNPLCVNPKHLRWATAKENAADREIHGTHLKGERNAFSKLTEHDVREMRRLAGHTSLEDLSARYGITTSRVDAIIKRIGWKHVA